MSLRSAIRSLFSDDRTRSKFSDSDQNHVGPRSIQSRYDAAQTSDENKRHWQWADSFSADASMVPGVRRSLRMRSRYEIANNSYAKGIVLTVANDTIGTGARLQCQGDNGDDLAEVEGRWAEWADATLLGMKLRTMVMSRIGDGEAFGMMVDNPRNPNPVKLDIKLIETDQVADIWMPMLLPNLVDGMVLDEFHNPLEYHVLKYHPGGLYPMTNFESESVAARYMLHLFRRDRPDQSRGVPEITPALPLFAQLRRFTLAVISAAEAIANHAAVIETNGPAVDGDSEGAEPYDLVELNRNMATVLPDGYHLNQPKPEQPATTYGEFKKEILNEIARCLNLPFNVAACNSSSYNYASGRLDHQVYFKSLSVDRHHVEKTILDRIFREWFFEASGVYRWGFPIPSHCWRWDRFADIDPATEATARLTRLATGSSYATEMAEQGKDPDEEQRSAAKYLGVTVAGFQELLRQRLFANQQATSLPGSTQGESANGQTTAA